MASDSASSSIDPETVAQALGRLNHFHRALFWAEKYHELSCREIADRLKLPEELIALQMRIMSARFVLAARDVEIGRPERTSAKAKRLFDSLAWTIKLRFRGLRAEFLVRRR